MLDPYLAVLAGFGALVLLTAWLPMVLREAPLSLPIVCVGIGATLWSIPGLPGTAPHPIDHPALTEHLTEIVVIIALMGAGLKIDRVLGWRSWIITWRLLGVAMPLTIAALAGLAYLLLGFGWATALLLAAALAPTDPVLASDVQVGPPRSGQEDETRFALTSEAGLNDGLAFPFVLLAVALANSPSDGGWFWSWITYAVLWKIGAGVLVGAAVGSACGWLAFRMPNRAKLSRTGDGFVALGITCLAYGVTEMLRGYGFLAVFVAALALRAAERNHAYHEKLHDFAEQLERLLMMALLVLFGGALADGGLLDALTWEGVVFGLLAVFVVRPLSGWIGLAGAAQWGGTEAEQADAAPRHPVVVVELDRDRRTRDREIAVAAGDLLDREAAPPAPYREPHRGEDLVGRQRRLPQSGEEVALPRSPRRARARRASIVASSASATAGYSAAGSACAIEPPTVPRLRIWKWPMGASPTPAAAPSRPPRRPSRRSVRGGRRDQTARRRGARRPAVRRSREMSIRFSKCVRRIASIGTRLCPPARTLASSPNSPSSLHRLGHGVGPVIGERCGLHVSAACQRGL